MAAMSADHQGAAPGDEGAHARPSYEGASARIEEIIRRLDSGEAGLRETLELVREGRGLIEYCAAELEAVGQGLEQLRLDELVTRLQDDAAAAARRADPERTA